MIIPKTINFHCIRPGLCSYVRMRHPEYTVEELTLIAVNDGWTSTANHFHQDHVCHAFDD